MASSRPWSKERVGSLFYVKGRIGWRGLKRTDFTQAGPYLVTGMHIRDDGTVDWAACFRVPDRKFSESPEIIVQAGDILITKDGTIGKVGFIDRLLGPTTLNSHLFLVRPLDESYVDRSFAKHVFRSQLFRDFIEQQRSGSTLSGLGERKFLRFEFPTPGLGEQQQIAAILDTIDHAIRQTEQIIIKLKQVRQGLLHDLLTRGIDDNGELRDSERHPEHFVHTSIGPIPRTWKLAKFGDSTRDVLLGTSKRGLDPMGDNLKLLKMGNLRWGGLDLTAVEGVARSRVEDWPRLLLAPADLLFNTRNTPELVGKTAVWRDEVSDVIVDNNILRVRFSSEVNGIFVAAFMGNGHGRQRVSQLATGTTSVAAIYWAGLKKFLIPVPPRMEQDRIVAHLDRLDSSIMIESLELRKLRAIRSGLGVDLLTGSVCTNNLQATGMQ